MDRYTNPSDLKGLRRNLRTLATPAERVLWKMLRKRQLDGWHFRRQHGLGRYIVDFFCSEAKLAIELDGSVHDSPARREYDDRRTEVIEKLGIAVIRFSNEDVLQQADVVLEAIREHLRAPRLE